MVIRALMGSTLFIGLLAIGFGVNARPPSSPFFWGVALAGYPITAARLEKLAKETRLDPQIVLFYLQWPASPQAEGFPQETLEAIWQRGALPCLSWEPMCCQDGREVMIAHERIVGGEYDDYLSEFAEKAKRWGKPLLIRFAHEMNLDRYHWGAPDKSGYGPRSPESYQNMFRYVVSYFRKQGANNVLWVFCPNSESIPNPERDPGASWNQARNYYPGDAYVDLLGMDGYNWGTTQTVEKNCWQSQWRSFQDIFTPLYRELKALSPHKPIIVFEIASASQGGNKSLWIKEAVATAKVWDLQGIVWFQVNKEVDWRINHGTDYSYVPIAPGQTANVKEWVTGLMKK